MLGGSRSRIEHFADVVEGDQKGKHGDAVGDTETEADGPADCHRGVPGQTAGINEVAVEALDHRDYRGCHCGIEHQGDIELFERVVRDEPGEGPGGGGGGGVGIVVHVQIPLGLRLNQSISR